jgi:hypothetical protein
MFIVIQMNADVGEAVRFVVAAIRNGSVAVSDPIRVHDSPRVDRRSVRRVGI